MLLELFPLLRLRRQYEIHHVARQQPKRAVIFLVTVLTIAARLHAAVSRRRFMDRNALTARPVRASLEQYCFDGFLKGALRDVRAHAASSRTSILPITAAEISAVRNSFRLSIPLRMLF